MFPYKKRETYKAYFFQQNIVINITEDWYMKNYIEQML